MAHHRLAIRTRDGPDRDFDKAKVEAGIGQRGGRGNRLISLGFESRDMRNGHQRPALYGASVWGPDEIVTKSDRL
jgi:hypothetical protein